MTSNILIKLISALDLLPSATLLHFIAMAIANPKDYSIKQVRIHSSPDDQVRSKEISDTKNCGKNNKLVLEDAKAICCEFCFIWYCTKCADMSDEINKFLRLGDDQDHWLCNKCNDQAMNFTRIVHGLMERNKYL